MANEANIKAIITADDKASAVIKNFGKNVDDSFKDIAGGISASMLAVGAATAGIVAFGKKSFDAFNAQDLAVTRLQAGINNVKTATDKHIDSLISQAAALQKTTRFSDEAYISAQGILSTFQLNQKAIAALTPRLADMSEGLARVTGEMPDMEGNAILVAKAIGGEDVTGLTGALRRVGVVMTKTQEELLKTGTVEQRVALVTQILDQNFKGMAEAAGGTTAGKVAELKNQFNDLQEKVGKLIAEALTPLLNILLEHPAVLTAVTAAVGALTFAFIALKVSAAISATISGVSAALGGLASAAGTATVAMTTLSAVSIMGWAALAVAAAFSVKAALDSVKGAFEAVNNAKISAANLSASQAINHQALLDLQRTGTPDQKARASKALAAGFATGGYTGMGNPNDIAGVVHKGEFVLPSNMVDQSTGRPKLGGSTVNININTGALMGNDVEARKFAQLIIRHYNDAMNSKSLGAY